MVRHLLVIAFYSASSTMTFAFTVGAGDSSSTPTGLPPPTGPEGKSCTATGHRRAQVHRITRLASPRPKTSGTRPRPGISAPGRGRQHARKPGRKWGGAWDHDRQGVPGCPGTPPAVARRSRRCARLSADIQPGDYSALVVTESSRLDRRGRPPASGGWLREQPPLLANIYLHVLDRELAGR
jgi:hypothetical protein